jgi:HAD superfamily hydrolase (TIGR01509 family)
VRAVVFDCDGLLLETESRWTLAEMAVCEQWDVPFSMELKRRLLGTSLDRAGELLAEWVGEPPEQAASLLAEQLITAYRAAVDEYGVDPMPGAAELVVALADRVPIAVASNTREIDTRRVLTRSGLPDLFTAIVCAGDGIAPKPAPDVYLAACAALRAEPSATIALEDSPTGVAAARAAGMHVIGVPSTPGVALDAHRVVPSLIEVRVDILEGSDA